MLATAAALLALPVASPGAVPAASMPQALFAGPSIATGQLDALGVQRLSRMQWRRYREAAGRPTVEVSDAYGDRDSIARRWSAFFESLIHGSELGLLNAYIAPLSEVQEVCGGGNVLGCYGDDHLVMPDEGSRGVSSTSIATHEYGHHIAFNRINPPWLAIDYGPKRWATDERVCVRTAAGTAYPGAEDANYPLNPGEAWAETYRVLNETQVGLPLTWPIVDSSFLPDAGGLAAAREDVVDPWHPSPVTINDMRFGSNTRTSKIEIATPLDGAFHVEVKPGADDITLLAAGTGSALRSGTWTQSGAKAIDYLVCGQRTFTLRVTRHTASRRFKLRVAVP
jgi:hypothetical protein